MTDFFKMNIDGINEMFKQKHHENHDQSNSPGQSEIINCDQNNSNQTNNTHTSEILSAKMWGRNQRD